MSQPFPPAPSEQHPSVPQGPYPGAPAPQPAAKRSWFARHKFLTGLGSLVLLIIVISALSGGGDTDPSAGGDVAPVADAPAADVPAADVPAADPTEAAPAPAEEPAAAGIGTPVRDGKFEFTVTAVEPGVASIGSDLLGVAAQGEFILVRVTVQNIGDKAQYFDGSTQKAFDAQGREFSADTSAAIYLDDSNSFLNEVNPGNTVNGTLVFDMPLGTPISALELHDSLFSGGVSVTL